MRVISQDGTFDMPYEMSIIWCGDDGAVLLQPIGETGEYQTFAKYSTEEKAKKAMEMLREAWINGTVEFEDGIFHRNIIFQFPTEEELE